jgi:hypothetical protein
MIPSYLPRGVIYSTAPNNGSVLCIWSLGVIQLMRTGVVRLASQIPQHQAGGLGAMLLNFNRDCT